MCICVYSNKILYPILPTALYLTLFTESFQWDLGVLSTSRVHGICWDKTLSKASLKGFEYLQKKKRGGRDANIFEGFFFSLSWQSLQLRTAEPSHVSLTLLSAVQYAHIRYQRTSLLHAFLGRTVCADVVYLGWGVGVQISRGGMRSNPSKLGF